MNILASIVLIALTMAGVQTNAESRSDPAPASVSLEKVFSADLSRDQRDALGPNADLERLRDALTPEQRESVRSRLSSLEASARMPEDLAAVARGYLLLDEHAPEAGQSALRIAEQLRRLRPKSSDGYELTAEGFNQSGDYPAAAEWAKKALELNPRDANARAIYMFTKDRTKPGDTSVFATTPTDRSAAVSGNTTVSPEAQAFMNRAVDARRKGDVNGMWDSVQAAMRVDPKSKEVQAFYSLAERDHAKYAETKADVEKSMAAYEAGDDAGAVEWARRAAERSQDETIGKILETMKAKVEKRRKAGSGNPSKTPGGAPLWPLAGLGLTAAFTGYGLYRGTNRTYASEDGLNPEPTVAPDQARKNYLMAAAVAGAAFVGLAAWEFGPAAWAMLNAAGPSAPAMTPAFAGAGASGGTTALVSEPAAVAAAKAGLITAGAYVGAKTISEHIRYAWDVLTDQMKKALVDSGLTDSRGTILTKP